MAEDDLKRIPSKGWAAMIRKVYEVDPMLCPKCGGRMKVVRYYGPYANAHRGKVRKADGSPLVLKQ